MSNRTGSRLALLPLAAVAVALLAANVMGAEPGPEAARLDSFTHPDGANYFALSLRPAEGVPAPAAHDVVVLFDTSASQTGDFRDQAIAALKSFLGSLALSGLPHTHFHALYQAWVQRVVALTCADLSGHFRLAPTETLSDRRARLDACRVMEREVQSLRAALRAETAFARKVELNTQIKKLEGSLARQLATL